jgi:hypothetical protein
MKKAMVMVMRGDGKEQKTHKYFFLAPENPCNKPLDPTKPQTPKQKHQKQQKQQQQQEKKERTEQNRTEAERDNNNTSIAILSSSKPMAANDIPIRKKNKKQKNKRLLSVYLFCLCCFSSLVKQ